MPCRLESAELLTNAYMDDVSNLIQCVQVVEPGSSCMHACMQFSSFDDASSVAVNISKHAE